MPYITDHARRVHLRPLSTAITAGELNYQLTQCVIEYLRSMGVGYQTLNDALGALEGAKLEFIRRIVNPYEQSKLETNGDVYGPLTDLLPRRANVWDPKV